MKNTLIFLIAFIASHGLWAQPQIQSHHQSQNQNIKLSSAIYANSGVPFVAHHGSGPFGKAMAMNIAYEPVKKVRLQLEQKLGYSLKIFKGWSSEGEAHVTTITPPEFTNVFSSFVGIQEIDEIARANDIQSSDLQFEGIGRGVSIVDGNPEETYFLLVKSERLLKIRREIYRLFIKRGGNPKSWDPEHFYPHITIGFTLRDLHESDGVIKDKSHALDERFSLELENK